MQEGADKASSDGLTSKSQQRKPQSEKSNRVEVKGYVAGVNVDNSRPAWSPAGKTTTGWSDYIKVCCHVQAQKNVVTCC
jgi:hypothetical protein